MRTRKNIECLNSNELHDLREAFAGIYQLTESNPKSFAKIAGLHGLPGNYCKHSSFSGFLSWHRAYLLELENALRDIKCNVTLPFWDWNSTTQKGIPEACKHHTYINRSGITVDNPLFKGPIAPSIGGGYTYRGSNINNISFKVYADMAANNQSQTNFNTYAQNLNNYHGSVHIRFNGSMSDADYAAFDPIFYFHHANIDRLWANWQQLHGIASPSSELNTILNPFTKTYSSNWYLGQDFQSIASWNYRYRNWCIIWDPIPWTGQVHVLRFKIEPWILESQLINLVLSSNAMPKDSFELNFFIF